MNATTAEDFKSYLREEVVRGSTGSHKKVVGTKVSRQPVPLYCMKAFHIVSTGSIMLCGYICMVTSSHGHVIYTVSVL